MQEPRIIEEEREELRLVEVPRASRAPLLGRLVERAQQRLRQSGEDRTFESEQSETRERPRRIFGYD